MVGPGIYTDIDQYMLPKRYESPPVIKMRLSERQGMMKIKPKRRRSRSGGSMISLITRFVFLQAAEKMRQNESTNRAVTYGK